MEKKPENKTETLQDLVNEREKLFLTLTEKDDKIALYKKSEINEIVKRLREEIFLKGISFFEIRTATNAAFKNQKNKKVVEEIEAKK